MPDRIDRLFNSMDSGSDAFFDAIRNGNERMLRFGKIMVEEAQRTQQENNDIARMWAHAPTNIVGVAQEAIATWTRRQRRRIEIGRGLMDELSGVGSETRDTIRRVASANRDAVAVGVSAGSEAISRASDEVSDRAEDVSDAAERVARNASRRRNAA